MWKILHQMALFKSASESSAGNVESLTAMGRKCRSDNNFFFKGFTTHKDQVELQSSAFSTATQSTIEGGASRSRSFSEGAVSLEISKVPCTDKHLMSESSSSNSSHASVPNGSSLIDQKSNETIIFSSDGLVSLKKDDQGLNLCGFDLNEDLEANEVGQMKNPIDQSVSFNPVASLPEPIVVVAKVGVPNGLPTAPLRFDGELGWRRSAAASAFHPALPSNNSTDPNTTRSLGFRGFDLNVAAPMDGSAETGLNESETHCRAQPKSRIQSFDLNDNLIDQDTMKGSARQNNSPGVRPAYWLSSMPGFTHVQGQPFLVAAPMLSSADQKQTLVPLQPTMAFAPAPPIGVHPGVNTTLPRIPGPVLAAYPGSLHLLETGTTQGPSPGGYTTMRPDFFLNGGVGSDKRREPEGGWDSYQLSHRRVATWK